MIVVWRITEQCNLSCPFCAYDKRLARSRVSSDVEQVLAFGAVLRDYAVQYNRDVLVSWLGGEPLLWPRLGEVSRIFRHEYGLRLGVTTNGTPLQSPRLRRHLIDHYNRITISIDGNAAFHDRMRGSSGLFARLEGAVRKLRALQAQSGGRGPIIGVNTVLMADNLDQFAPLCETLAKWGVEELTFNALGGNDRPEFFRRHRLTSAHIACLREELPRIRARVGPLGLRVRGSADYFARLDAAAREIAMPVDDCAPGQRFLFIDERGYVSPCSFTAHGYGIPIGELRGAQDIANLPHTFAARRAVSRHTACGNCLSTQVFGKFA